jgi:hypothetical protein
VREREREERKVVSFVAYFSLRWEIRKLLAVLPLLLWSDCRPKKSLRIRNQRKDMYLRARPMPDNAPVMRAYPVLSAALLPPVREGGEAEDNNFDRRHHRRLPHGDRGMPGADGADASRAPPAARPRGPPAPPPPPPRGGGAAPAPPPLRAAASAARRYPRLCFRCCHPPSLPWPSLRCCCC